LELLSLAVHICTGLAADLKKLAAENKDLKAEIRELKDGRAAPAPDPSNSGIPPSQDPFNRGRPGGEKQEEEGDCPEQEDAGARKRRRRCLRSPFPTEGSEIREIDDFKGRTCPRCGSPMERAEEHDRRKDHYETDPSRAATRVIELSLAYRCAKCKIIHRSGKPAGGFSGGLFPAGLIANLLFLKMRGHMSLRALVEYLKVSYDITISLGGLNKILKQASAAVRPIYLEVLDAVRLEEHTHIDESPTPFNGKRLYSWVFRCARAIAFAIGTRCGDMLKKVLGDGWAGIISCDAFSVYMSYARGRAGVVLQLCLEHLKRDFVHCSQYDAAYPRVRAYGDEGARLIRELIHNYNLLKDLREGGLGGSPEAADLEAKLSGLRERLTSHALTAPPECPKARGIARRFRDNPDYYFVFPDCPGVPPTNNPAEISIRGTVVNDRKVSYGPRGRRGIRFLETFWTLFTTMNLLGVDPTAFLEEALRAASEGRPLPSLLNPGKAVDPAYVEMAKEEARTDRENDAFDKKLAAERKRLASEKKKLAAEKKESAEKTADSGQEDRPRKGGAGQPRQRGRPPKSGTSETGTARPRPRGRPPKSGTAETGTARPRPRGRPPKSGTAETGTARPRPRGRPPKSGTAETGTARPRPKPTAAEPRPEPGTAEPRRRGRPPKPDAAEPRPNVGRAKTRPMTVMAGTRHKVPPAEPETAEKHRGGRPPKGSPTTLQKAPGPVRRIPGLALTGPAASSKISCRNPRGTPVPGIGEKPASGLAV
jgi:hypothetical protein